jgi:Zn-dependent protease
VLRSWKLGRVFGIDLFVHWTFLLLPFYVLLTSHGGGVFAAGFKLLLVAAVFACVVLHEMGHALTARRFGIGTRDVTLYPIGGVARLERMSKKPSEELLIALAGPAVNVAIVAALSPLVVPAILGGVLHAATLSATEGPLVLGMAFLGCVWLLNLVMVAFNLLPTFPMDGGRVLRALLAMKLGHLRATEIASAVGLVMAGLMGAVGIWQHSPMLVVIAAFVSVAGHFELMASRRASRKPVFQAVPVKVADPSAQAVEPGFSGFVWDQDHRAWVVWHNGRPVLPFGRPLE